MPVLHLSGADFPRVLAGLSPVERLELLQLLQAQEVTEAERPARWKEIDAHRVPIEHYLKAVKQEYAGRTADPAAYLAALDAHEAAAAVHRERLRAEREAPDSAEAHLAAFADVWRQAAELATRDGFPHPDQEAAETTETDTAVAVPERLPAVTREDGEAPSAKPATGGAGQWTEMNGQWQGWQ